MRWSTGSSIVSQADAEDDGPTVLRYEEGIFCGPSAAGACCIALRVARQEVDNATIVFIVCDRGDRYLSMGLFPG